MKKAMPPLGSRPNPVAKHAKKFNRSVVFADRKGYTRKTKHKAGEPFPMSAPNAGAQWKRLAGIGGRAGASR